MQTIIEKSAATHFFGFSGDKNVVSMNVSEEADAEFVRLLQKEDPDRYARLQTNMRRSIQRSPTTISETRYCENQSVSRHPMPQDARANAAYCDRACQQEAYRTRISS
jgi:hypothetical protein